MTVQSSEVSNFAPSLGSKLELPYQVLAVNNFKQNRNGESDNQAVKFFFENLRPSFPTPALAHLDCWTVSNVNGMNDVV